MTALCTGGTSAPKTGVSVAVLLGSGYLAETLLRYGAEWVRWLIPWLTLPELDLNTFCTTDPPAIPAFTSAEATALLKLQLGADFNSGLAKMPDLLLHIVWYELCQCTSGTLIPLGAAAAAPTGAPVYQGRPPPASSTCGTAEDFFSQDDTVPISSHQFTTSSSWSTRFTAMHLTVSWSPIAGSVQMNLTPIAVNSGMANTTYPSQLLYAAGGTYELDYQLPWGAIDFGYNLTYASGIGLTSVDVKYFAYCDGDTPWGSRAPCCPPDSTTQLQLDAILNMVTLLQRQLAPFASILGTAHAGLTGQGSFAVQGLLGLRLELTTIPTSSYQDNSVPPYVFNAGWVSVLDANGFIEETRAHAAEQSWFPRIASDAITVGYSFPPGVVATITEVLREP